MEPRQGTGLRASVHGDIMHCSARIRNNRHPFYQFFKFLIKFNSYFLALLLINIKIINITLTVGHPRDLHVIKINVKISIASDCVSVSNTLCRPQIFFGKLIV